MGFIDRFVIDYGAPDLGPAPAREPLTHRAHLALVAVMVMVLTAYAAWFGYVTANADNRCTTETAHLAMDRDPDTRCSTPATTEDRG